MRIEALIKVLLLHYGTINAIKVLCDPKQGAIKAMQVLNNAIEVLIKAVIIQTALRATTKCGIYLPCINGLLTLLRYFARS